MRPWRTCRRKHQWKTKLKKSRVLLFVFAASGLCLADAAKLQQTLYQDFLSYIKQELGYRTACSFIPAISYDPSQVEQKTCYDYLFEGVQQLMPIYGYARVTDDQPMEEMAAYYGLPVEEDKAAVDDGQFSIDEMLLEENQAAWEAMDVQGARESISTGKKMQSAGKTKKSGKARFSRKKLNDFDYLLQHFYRVDSTTTTNSRQLNAAEMLKKDMTVSKKDKSPQILIYHTHSQEGYADSKGSSQTVLGLGETLAQLLEADGYGVLHHTGVYDLPDRDHAYSRAAPALEQILKEHPSIQVIIDLHRDGVAEGTHLVETVNGKQTANIMFFNGLSHTTSQGDIAYLHNPNLADNLAFSFQMQLAAEEKYPGFSKCIYLKGYRYNLHYLPKSLLVEVGAQTNTYEEAENAMEPLAEILETVLQGS